MQITSSFVGGLVALAVSAQTFTDFNPQEAPSVSQFSDTRDTTHTLGSQFSGQPDWSSMQTQFSDLQGQMEAQAQVMQAQQVDQALPSEEVQAGGGLEDPERPVFPPFSQGSVPVPVAPVHHVPSYGHDDYSHYGDGYAHYGNDIIDGYNEYLPASHGYADDYTPSYNEYAPASHPYAAPTYNEYAPASHGYADDYTPTSHRYVDDYTPTYGHTPTPTYGHTPTHKTKVTKSTGGNTYANVKEVTYANQDWKVKNFVNHQNYKNVANHVNKYTHHNTKHTGPQKAGHHHHQAHGQPAPVPAVKAKPVGAHGGKTHGGDYGWGGYGGNYGYDAGMGGERTSSTYAVDYY